MTGLRLMPCDIRDKYRCVSCGKKPVKYFIESKDPFDEYKTHEYAYCSVCALKKISATRDENTFVKDGDN